MIPQPGDLLLVAGTAWWSPLIMKATHSPVSHVAIFIDDEVVIEALLEVKTRTLKDSLSDCNEAWVCKPTNIFPYQRNQIIEAVLRHSADNYGYGKIVLQALDVLFHTRWFTENFAKTNSPICSWLAAEAYHAAGLDFGVSPLSATPGDIYWFAVKNRDKYQMEKIL